MEPPPAADPLLPGVWDTQRGFKLFRGPVARQLFAQLHTTGFAFDVEVLSTSLGAPATGCVRSR